MRHFTVDFTPDERDLVVRVLEEVVGEDRTKLHGKRLSAKFRGELQKEEGILRELLERLMQAHPELGV
jgi:hypothetical protein